MHKLCILAMLVFCIKISHGPNAAAASSADENKNDASIFAFIGNSLLNFIQDCEEPNTEPKYDLTKEIPRSFFLFITGQDTNTTGDENKSGLGHTIANGILNIMDGDIGSTEIAKPITYTYENIDVMQFLFNSFFRYLIDAEGANETVNFNIYKQFFSLLHL